MAVAVLSNWRAWVVSETTEAKNWVVVPIVHERFRAVLIQCDSIHIEWYRDCINRYSAIEGRLERYLTYLHRTGVSMGLVMRVIPDSSEWSLVYQSHETDVPYVTDRPCMIYNLDNLTDATIVQRALDKCGGADPDIEKLLCDLIQIGALNGTITHYDFV